jgi:hypothetical protein
MAQADTNIKSMDNWKTKTLVIGAIVGAAVGVTAAYLFTQKADDYMSRPQFRSSDGVKLGLLLLGLVRQVAELGDGTK